MCECGKAVNILSKKNTQYVVSNMEKNARKKVITIKLDYIMLFI